MYVQQLHLLHVELCIVDAGCSWLGRKWRGYPLLGLAMPRAGLIYMNSQNK